ncbi:uracil-DNA glycosylase [Streptomyces sp. NPDC093970]|uniref:uracil-DNA glycosylase n=1 Tax=Streptomyces sp. NPDC093970 TaxID=3155076 RepID=UPI00342CD4D9
MESAEIRRFWKLLHGLAGTDDAQFLYGNDAAGRLRERNLRRYLELMDRIGPRMLLIGEAPGYRGHAVTGIPFMSVAQLRARPGLITGAPEGDGFEVPTDTPALSEASSTVVWRTVAVLRGPAPMFWPVYPNHPHEPGRPLTNRPPRTAEVTQGTPIALALMAAFRIRMIVAVGRKAQGALARNGVEAVPIRHPAQGGARTFAAQLARLDQEDGPYGSSPGSSGRAPGER